MKKIAGLCAALALSMPFAVSALEINLENGFPFSDVDSFVAGIISSTNASSSTGGKVAPGGVTVSGDTSASARVKTIMNSGSSSTIYKTEIQTEVDGVVRTETEMRTIPTNVRMEIRLATTSARVNPILGKTAATTSTSASPAFPFPKVQNSIFSSFWKSVRSFFGLF